MFSFIKSALYLLLSNQQGLSKLKSIRASFLLHDRINVRIYKNTTFFIAKTAKFYIEKRATLKIGTAWKHTNFSSSTFNIGEGATVEIQGNFNLQTGIFISVANGNWTNPATWDANAVPTGADSAIVAAHTVTIDAASLSINNLTVQGSLEFGATPTTFNVNGNLTVEAGGEFLVFNGTTGKAIVVSGNIVNDGKI